jgi:hypothetical protein
MPPKKIVPVGPGVEELPPAGFERDEELARRQDNLDEAAETRAASAEIEAIDPKKLKVENEVAQHFGLDGGFNELEVSNADKNYVYCWVFSGLGGRMIRTKMTEYQTLTHRNDGGWEVVGGNTDSGEALELKGIGADTTRRIGDTILMRIRKDCFKLLEKARKMQAARRQSATESELVEHADRLGLKVYTPDNMPERVQEKLFNQGRAKEIAGKHVNKWLREGRMPGTPLR